jgi:processive 1,2-diacylglycerol beta-glucosyltransferase
MNVVRPLILILTPHLGGGHLNLAQALKEMLEPGYDVTIVNPQREMIGRSYTSLSRHCPKAIELQYIVTDTARTALWYHRLLALSNRARILALLEHYQPRLVITTHALLSYATARAIERSRKAIPLVFQLTDLERLHKTWFTEKKADAYLAPSEEIFAQALREGIDESRLHLTGRPVRRQFLEASPEQGRLIREKLGFDATTFTIFLQGGAGGSAGFDRIIDGVLGMDVPVQIIMATGNNGSTAARYAGIARVRCLPFTPQPALYMAIADVIVGKAGASFITEAFTLEKPFLATAFIGGQETPNLDFIERHNLGWVRLKTSEQMELLNSLARRPEMIAEKMVSIRSYKTWNRAANQHLRPTIDRLLS